MIQDQLDGTQEASPDLGDGLRGRAFHSRHAARHTIGNWLPCFSCSCTQDEDYAAATLVFSCNPQKAAKSVSGIDGGYDGKLKFNRVAMSNKIRSVIQSIHNLCDPISDLLNKIPNISTAVTIKRAPTGSTKAQPKLFGRSAIFEKTVNALTGGTYNTAALSVLPFVGPGGIGKTTFAQHLYNDKRIEGHFNVRVWVCVSTDFDVMKLTRQILSCIPPTEKEETNTTAESTNLDQLQKSIADRLESKRFLIVLDDIWKCNSEGDWENLLAPFRKGESKGSMVLVTTRFPSISQIVETTDPIILKGLESNDFLELFEACIFGDSKPEHYEDDLIDVSRDIAKKLKGSPLAANAVGRLLRKNLSREYWMELLENNEWENTNNDDDIMPSLKISYNYLPFYLKKCFSYCALFPEDHRFDVFEITRFWIALGIIESSCQNNKYLEELVDNGFVMKGVDRFGDQYYVMHDLLHELSRNVSSQECINISTLTFSADNIPQSIRHLSITIEDIYDESFEEEMHALKSTIDIRNLRTLMIFGSYDDRIADILKDTFDQIEGLRVLFIAMNTPQSLPSSFSNLIHLRYLRISSPYKYGFVEELNLPSSLSRFYHLKFLDLQYWHGSKKLPKDISRLVNLRNFHSSKEFHSNIPEVGRMKCLQELKKFIVKKENAGFELRELGKLRELGGALSICNLETVSSKGEACEAKLKNKRNLKELMLVWGAEHQNVDDDVLDGLHPHYNLRVLGIINPGTAPCPSWLCGDISTKRLKSLHLEGVCWVSLPPFEHLPHLTKLTLKNVVGMRKFGPGFGGLTERSFMHLKTIVFKDMPELVEWVGRPNIHPFSKLESINFGDCPVLRSFPFLKCSEHLSKLCRLHIDNCPVLSQLPPLPHTSALNSVCVRQNGRLKLLRTETKLTVAGYSGALLFSNMDKVEVVKMSHVSHISFSDLQKLNSLRSLDVKRCDSMFSVEMEDSVVLHSVRNLHLEQLCISGELFSMALKRFPALSQLTVSDCNSLNLLPVEDGGLLDLTMLQSFKAFSCPKMFSMWPIGGAHTIKPFPPSLRELEIYSDSSMKSMALLSNLTSLAHLHLTICEKLAMDGFNPLIAVNLKELAVFANMYLDKQNSSIGEDLLSKVKRSRLLDAGSFQLEHFVVDSISAVLVAPVCSHLSATLHTLNFHHDMRAETFMEEQEQSLHLLTSLKQLEFRNCPVLQSLPQGLNRLHALRVLLIFDCPKIPSLPPKEGLPASLQTLQVMYCSPELSEKAEKLKRTDPYFSAILSVFSA
uniref:Uncharacterized protein n=3 Tax=Avena sativa TaxID=4498 RepID=A0ACD5ZG54_AVESA